ncbi:MAG: AAA family ATPase, partial [Clostridia bacterium]|nr:AAA family ATPase [Clostridia bacterium]
YADRIRQREELKDETKKIADTVAQMAAGVELFREFFAIVRLTGHASELGKCKNQQDVARWLYRETVKKYKQNFGMKGVYPSDGYALCAVLTAAGRRLTPRYGLVFIDEGQDISRGEYRLLGKIHADAAFNVFGDLKQNITHFRGIGDWSALGYPVYRLNRNYRNTNEIVEYVSHVLDVDMAPIGLGGKEVERLKPRGVSGYFRGKQGLRAVIAKEEYLHLFEKRGFRILPPDGKLSKTGINVMSVYESKGLEFSAVAVYDKGMTENEKYIAYTRALRELAIIEEG